jgi:hypothetical protein
MRFIKQPNHGNKDETYSRRKKDREQARRKKIQWQGIF